MGIVSLPSMDDIQQQKDPKQQMEMLINTLGILMKELGEINGYLGGANIRANSITAVKLDVDKLSAITADIGEITAGIIRGIEIYGSYIATSESYPRTEMDVTGNFLAAISVPGTYLAITPQGFGSVPSISIVSANSIVGFLNRSIGGTTLGTFGGENLNFQASGNLVINASGDINVGSQSGVSGTFYVAPTSGSPATIPITFTKGIRTG